MEIIGIVIVMLLVFFVNGIIGDIEDNSPGGFNDPNGKWVNSFKNPSKIQKIVWSLGVLTIGFLIYAIIV